VMEFSSNSFVEIKLAFLNIADHPIKSNT